MGTGKNASGGPRCRGRRPRRPAAAFRTLGCDDATFAHISTGGGASLGLLEGKTLPGIAVLED